METTTKTTTAKIKKASLAAFEHDLEKQVNRRARKLGLPEATFTIDREFTERRPTERGGSTLVTFIEITVAGETPVIDGYDVAAVIDHDETGNVVHQIHGYQISDDLKDGPAYCDHCQTKRRRKTTIILAKTDGQRLIRVGKACLKDFTGCGDPHAIHLYLTSLAALCADIDDDYERPIRCGNAEVDVAEIVSAGALYAWAFGERYDKNEMKGYATGRGLTDFGKSRSGASLEPDWHEEARKALKAGAADSATRAACDAEAERIIDWVAAFDVDANGAHDMADYWRNLKIATGHPYQPAKRANLIASAFACYRGKLAFIANREAKAAARKIAAEQAAESTYAGEIGKRIKKAPATVASVRHYTTEHTYSYEDDGARSCIRFVDAEGRIIVWFTSPSDLEKGQTVLLSHTPKKHEERDGTKQTISSRCKVEITEAAA